MVKEPQENKAISFIMHAKDRTDNPEYGMELSLWPLQSLL